MNLSRGRNMGRMTRRELLERGGSALTLAATSSLAPLISSGCNLAKKVTAKPSVKVGILHSQTGTMSISEIPLLNAELSAIEEINAAGGILGRQLEPIMEDPRSRFNELFPKKARKLLEQDQVAVVFGCWTSTSRKAVLPIFEELNGLLFYPLQYEGNESSKSIIYTGAVPNQQILPAVDWLLSPAGGAKQRFYLIGSDYVFPRTANLIITKYLASRGLSAAGETYTPLGHTDYASIIQNIKAVSPDVIISTINGDSNIHFYNELSQQGNAAEQIPVMATSVGEYELLMLLPAAVRGHFAAWTYFQSVDTRKNKHFVRRYREEYGPDRVTDDPMEAAYVSVYLWKAAVEKAGSFEVDKVREALRSGIEFEGPGGLIKIDPKTQHCYKRCRVGRIRDDRQFDILYESPDLIEPDPYPQLAFPGWRCDWTQGGLTRGPEVAIGAS